MKGREGEEEEEGGVAGEGKEVGLEHDGLTVRLRNRTEVEYTRMYLYQYIFTPVRDIVCIIYLFYK